MTFKIAIIGRPNVGKSTLFNRLAGKQAGARRRYARRHPRPPRSSGKLYDLTFDVIDTAGFEDADADSLQGRMRQQTEIAIGEADLIFFMVDAKAGVMPDDRTFAEIVRKSGKPVVLVANKAEARGAQGGFLEAWELGLGEPVAGLGRAWPGPAGSARRRRRSAGRGARVSTRKRTRRSCRRQRAADRRGHRRCRRRTRL